MSLPPTPDGGWVLAVDVGGTKLAAGLVTLDGEVVEAQRADTPAEDPEIALLALIMDVLAARPEGVVRGVGIGCGGPMVWPQGRVSPVNIPAWRDFPLRDELAQRFPDRPVRLMNDAVCLAVAEHWRGAGQGVDDMIGMVVSTGVGGGIVLGGRVLAGRSGNAGHLGHVVVEPDGPPCGCGGRGCLEAVARGPALVAWARDRGWTGTDGRELAAAARDGHPVAVAAFERAGRAIGLAVAGAVATLDVGLVVVGGGIAAAGELLFGPLRAELAARARLDFLRDVLVTPAALGEHAGLVGAAALVACGDSYWPR